MTMDPETLEHMEMFIGHSLMQAATACFEEFDGEPGRDDMIQLIVFGVARALSGVVLASSVEDGCKEPNAELARQVLSAVLEETAKRIKFAIESGWYEHQLGESRKEEGAGMEQRLH